jgi:multidrug efflux pump subunit AcrA (membrane-fusion protein)
MPVPAGRLNLPASALILRGGGTKVATVDASGKVHFANVTIAQDQGNSVDISSGLKPGEKVIDSPPDSLLDGQKVHVAGGANG